MSEQDLTPEQLEQLREELASVAAGDVVAEAAMSLIALAYVRLGIPPEQHARFRDLDAARLLVDALGGMLSAPEGRLGAPSPPLGTPPEEHARFRALAPARLLVDALGGMLSATAGRLGPPEPTLRDA